MRSVSLSRILVLPGLLFALIFLAAGSRADLVRAQESGEPLSEAEIEQLVAPIALHPDALVSQVLMASTYPLEVVEAQRWVKANKDVTGAALEEAMQKQPWDPSVKSLTAFPQVLDMMNDELSWTQQLGDAFLAQQEDILAAIQTLRAKADAAGHLETTKEQKVVKQTAPAPSGSSASTGAPPPETGGTPPVAGGATQTIYVIEPSDPEVIYVPSYDPTVVYGDWGYPAYPPYYWYPPGYVAGNAFWFATGVAVGSALWGHCDWGRYDIDIDVDRYNDFNRTNITNNKWEHNSIHRKGVAYRHKDVAERYGKGHSDARARARDQFRGRAESGRRDLASVKPGKITKPELGGKRPDLSGKKPKPAGKKPNVSGKRPNLSAKKPAPKKPVAKKPAAKPKVAARPPQAKKPSARKVSRPAKQPAAFKGVHNGHQVKRHSARGQASRHASRARQGGGHRGGGHRGGGRRR